MVLLDSSWLFQTWINKKCRNSKGTSQSIKIVYRIIGKKENKMIIFKRMLITVYCTNLSVYPKTQSKFLKQGFITNCILFCFVLHLWFWLILFIIHSYYLYRRVSIFWWSSNMSSFWLFNHGWCYCRWGCFYWFNFEYFNFLYRL